MQDILKIAAIFISVISIALAFIQGNIYHLATEAATVTLVSLFCPFFFALFFKVYSRQAAYLSMFFGLLTWILFSVMSFEFPSQLAGFIASLSVYFCLGIGKVCFSKLV